MLFRSPNLNLLVEPVRGQDKRRRLVEWMAARKDELRDLLAEQAKLKVREGQLEESWMEALEVLETLQAELEALS